MFGEVGLRQIASPRSPIHLIIAKSTDSSKYTRRYPTATTAKMPSFKSLSSKMLGGIKRKGGGGGGGADATADNDSGRSGGSDSIDLQNGSPEAIASRSVVR